MLSLCLSVSLSLSVCLSVCLSVSLCLCVFLLLSSLLPFSDFLSLFLFVSSLFLFSYSLSLSFFLFLFLYPLLSLFDSFSPSFSLFFSDSLSPTLSLILWMHSLNDVSAVDRSIDGAVTWNPWFGSPRCQPCGTQGRIPVHPTLFLTWRGLHNHRLGHCRCHDNIAFNVCLQVECKWFFSCSVHYTMARITEFINLDTLIHG